MRVQTHDYYCNPITRSRRRRSITHVGLLTMTNYYYTTESVRIRIVCIGKDDEEVLYY